jgi:hypothetical protein
MFIAYCCNRYAIAALRPEETRGMLPPWPTRRKFTPVEVLEHLLHRLEKRTEALERVKLSGFEIVIAELEVEQDYLRPAMRHLEG